MRQLNSRRTVLTLVLIAAILNYSTRLAMATPSIVLHNWSGTIDFLDDPAPFSLHGTASHLGNFDADGEVEFEPDGQGGMEGTGVIVFTSANGDRLVGLVTSDVAAGGDVRRSELESSWRDISEAAGALEDLSIAERDVAANRPRGLVVIAILIGLLVPAVQKFR